MGIKGVIITSKHNNNRRFIRYDKNIENQEWILGWGFNADNSFASVTTDADKIYYHDQLPDIMELANNDKTSILWINRFKEKENLVTIIENLQAKNSNFLIAMHDIDTEMREKFTVINYSLSILEQIRYNSIFDKEKSKLNPLAPFDDIDFVFFSSILQWKKKTTTMLMPIILEMKSYQVSYIKQKEDFFSNTDPFYLKIKQPEYIKPIRSFQIQLNNIEIDFSLQPKLKPVIKTLQNLTGDIINAIKNLDFSEIDTIITNYKHLLQSFDLIAFQKCTDEKPTNILK